MKITFLGTGTSQGIPVIACDCPVCRSVDFRDKRLRTSVHVQSNDTSIVIDCGPDFRQQMLNAGITHLSAVVFTHEHKDHVAGLDDIRAFNFRQKSAVPVYAHSRVISHLKQEFPYIFAVEKYPGIPSVALEEIDQSPFEINDLQILPIKVMHYKLPVLGFRIEDFTYITDANHIDSEELEKIQGSKVLVLNALQKDPHISHFNLEQAVALVKKINPQQAFFTHISHRLGIHQEVSEQLPPNIRLAFDGLSLNL